MVGFNPVLYLTIIFRRLSNYWRLFTEPKARYPASRGPSIFLGKSGRGRDLCQPPRLSHPPKRMRQSGLKPVFPVFKECACALLEIAD